MHIECIYNRCLKSLPVNATTSVISGYVSIACLIYFDLFSYLLGMSIDF